MTTLTSELRQKLISLAETAQENAYVPYSKFNVGAAIYTEAGDIFTGCNVENISYGLTNCAERTAIFSMVAAKGPMSKIKYIAITTKAGIPCSPCGACRQVLQEFGTDAIIIYKGPNGYVDVTMSQLLPGAFTDFVAIEADGTQKTIHSGV